MLRIRISVISLLLASATFLVAQPRPRINQRIDGTRVLRVAGSTHRAIGGARDLGRANADLPMERIVMELASSAEQQADLEQLLAAQHDPSAPEFQKWLTPEEFGERFGPA